MKREQNKYSIDFFLSQESFIDWVRGNNLHNSYWVDWIGQHPEAKEQFEAAKFIASEIKIKEEEINPVWIEQIKGKIDTSIDAQEVFQFSTTRNRDTSSDKLRWIYFAAAISTVLIVSFFLSFYGNGELEPQAPHFYIKEAQPGQKLSFYLKDGTKVKLNSASSLQYSDFTDTSREVYLTGEAFFDVARDTLRPFTVTTNNVHTRVLGTSFNINSQTDKGLVTVALLSGEVEMRDNDSVVKLLPGQVAVSERDADIKFIETDISRLTAWKDGIIMFDHATMQEVLNELSKWYGVQFVISGVDPGNTNWKYTGNFDNQNLQVVLMSLSYVKKFNYEIKSDTIYINY